MAKTYLQLTEQLNENFQKLLDKHGIEKKGMGLGFSEKEQKWYGWSHRAVCGFKVGDKIFEADYGDDETPFTKHGSKECKTLDDCKKAAKAFADYVS